jgi:hypothetical protein
MFKKLFSRFSLVAALLLVPIAALAADAVQGAWQPSLIWDGTGFNLQRNANVFKTLASTVITSETTVWTPAANKKFRLMGFCLTQGVATGNVTLKDNTAGATIFIIPATTIAVSGCVNFPGNGILSAAANNVLTATGASTETITGTLFGTEE